jgi:hypothetical protein
MGPIRKAKTAGTVALPQAFGLVVAISKKSFDDVAAFRRNFRMRD